jgi:hypothetical protein
MPVIPLPAAGTALPTEGRSWADRLGAPPWRIALQLIVEDVAQAFGENQRENEVLELRCLLRTSDAAGGVPNPGLERLIVSVGHHPSVVRLGENTGKAQAAPGCELSWERILAEPKRALCRRGAPSLVGQAVPALRSWATPVACISNFAIQCVRLAASEIAPRLGDGIAQIRRFALPKNCPQNKLQRLKKTAIWISKTVGIIKVDGACGFEFDVDSIRQGFNSTL